MKKNIFFEFSFTDFLIKKCLKTSLLALLFTSFSCTSSDDNPVKTTDTEENKESSAKYAVTFNLNWNRDDFPVDYPNGSHFSRIVGWSHKPTSNFINIGTLASTGIKNVAETGSTSQIKVEIEEKIANKEGNEFYEGSSLGRGVGKIEIEVTVDEDYPSISLITMIAPSPDWYVGIINLNLLVKNTFIQDTTLIGKVYDSGTDDGLTFNASNKRSTPQQKIYLIKDLPLGDGESVDEKFCTVEIKKL